MNRIFLSTNGSRLARAECGAGGEWAVEHLLEGTNVRCLAADPRHPHIVYAGTQGSGVLRSDDQGKTWQQSGMAGQIVKSVTVSAAEPGLIFAGTKPPGVFVSRDAGQHWTELEAFRRMRRWWWFTPAEWPPTQPYVQGLAASPTDANVVVAGIELGAVLRSADGGQSWSGHQAGALHDCHSLAFHPTNGDWVYEGGGDGGAAFSRDGGMTWTRVKAGLQRGYGWAASGDPRRPEVIYCATSPGPRRAHGMKGNADAYIYRCQDGESWERLSGGLPQPLNYMPYALLTDPGALGHVYAGLSNGDVWHTADYGDHWRQLPLNLGNIFTAMILL